MNPKIAFVNMDVAKPSQKRPPEDEEQNGRPSKRHNHNASRTGAYFTTPNYELLLLELERLRSQAKLNKGIEQTKTKIKTITKKSKLSRQDFKIGLKEYWISAELPDILSLDHRLDKFLDYHLTKPTKGSVQAIAVKYSIDVSGLSLWSMVKKIMTEMPFVEDAIDDIPESDATTENLIMLDKGSFYHDNMKESSRLFHSMANRLESLNSCFVKLKAIKDVADKKFALNGTRNLDGLVEQIDGCVLENMGVKLPFKLEEVRKALSKGEITSAYLQVYLCPLRDHIGKDNKSKTGHLLCSIENEYFKGILGLT